MNISRKTRVKARKRGSKKELEVKKRRLKANRAIKKKKIHESERECERVQN